MDDQKKNAGLFINRLGKNLEDATATETHEVLMAHFDPHSPDYNPDEGTARSAHSRARSLAELYDERRTGNVNGGNRDRPKALRNLITAWVKDNPRIKPAKVIGEIRKLAPDKSGNEKSIIQKFDYTNKRYEWLDERGKTQTSKLSGIPHLLRRIKKSLR